VVPNHPRGQGQDPLGACKGAPQGKGAGAVSPGGGHPQDRGRAADSGGGADVGGLSGNCNVAVGNLAPGTSRFTSSVLLVTLYAMNPRISMDPGVCHGKPTIRGTRVLVSTLLGALAGGDSMEQIQQDYEIAREDIVAALEFAKEASDCQISVYEAVA